VVSALALRLKDRLYGEQIHPYQHFERQVLECLRGRRGTLLDIGCGREAPVLRRFKDAADHLIGLELVDYRVEDPDVKLLHGSISSMPLPDQSVDVIMARSVIEHVEDPVSGFREVRRVLKPGGSFVFLTANIWDYASLIAMMVPNRLHPWIVAKSEGRAEEDVFPTVYRCNSKRAITRIAASAGLEIADFRYLSQYPNYFMFNSAAFLLASAYEKLITSTRHLAFLRGWVLVTLRKA